MSDTLEATWREILSLVRQKLPLQTYETWFAPLRPAARVNGSFAVTCPSAFFRDWFSEHHLPLLEDAVSRCYGQPLKCLLNVDQQPTEPADLFALASEGVPVPGAFAGAEEMPPEEEPKDRRGGPALAEEYTFDNFIVGSGVQLAHAAAIAVTKRPGEHFNPLFIHGGVGLGKTHLLHAVGNGISANFPAARVLYVTAERFMTDLVVSIKQHTTHEFKARYRSSDVLLVDDVEFLAGKESTQEEFFHTFNTLHHEKRQIVMTSDRSPKEMTTLAERLRSRFEWGLLVDIQPPDLETRIAILSKKIEVNDIQVDEDVIHYIAQNITTNIRRLEGALIRLLAFASLTAREINLEMASEVLLPYFQASAQGPVLIADVMREVCSYYGVTVDQLKSKRRTQDLALARQVGMFIAREKTGASLNQIGRAFGNRDHSTVLHGCQKVRTLMAQDQRFKGQVRDIMDKL